MTTTEPLAIAALPAPPSEFSIEAAVATGADLTRRGAKVIDVGADAVTPEGESLAADRARGRITAVVAGLAAAGIPVSVQTTDAETALLAVDQGASYINDISGGALDRQMARAAVATGAVFIAGDWQTVADVETPLDAPARLQRLRSRAEQLVLVGLDRSKLVLNPGFGLQARDVPFLAGLLGVPLMIEVSNLDVPDSTEEKITATFPWLTHPGVWAARITLVGAPARNDAVI